MAREQLRNGDHMAGDLMGALRRGLADWQTGWSIGTFGAIAEFHQDEGETAVVDRPDRLERATNRGAIRLLPHADLRTIAYEALSPRPHRWIQGVALCLPAETARRKVRTVVTELGPDEDAIRPEDRSAILFDMGLGAAQIDFCVRTRNPELLAALREAAGQPINATHVMLAILKAHPHRVAISHLGRCEVYQKIGGPDTGGVSPPGPHTHVLPKLLATGRTHSANTPIPDGLVPCGFMHPGNPVIGQLGEDRVFDPALFASFEAMLAAWGPAEYIAAKRQVWALLDEGALPAALAPPTSRLARTGVRNALRQRARIVEGDAKRSALVAAWRAAHDGAAAPTEADDESPGH